MRNHRLRERRQRLGMSQGQIAAAAGLRYAYYVSVAEVHGHLHYGDRVRRALIDIELQRRVKRKLAAHKQSWLASERARVARQEALWAALPTSPEKIALQAAMLDRCIDLMDAGDGEACDAIAEWLPPNAVQAMFDHWENRS